VGLIALGGIENPRLYSQTYFGTKRLLEEYIDEGIIHREHALTSVERCLSYLNELHSFSGEERRLFCRHLGRNYGRTVSIILALGLHLLGLVSFGRRLFGLLSFCTNPWQSL
jgi:hypothetical protein